MNLMWLKDLLGFDQQFNMCFRTGYVWRGRVQMRILRHLPGSVSGGGL